jgi:hypothetical protein
MFVADARNIALLDPLETAARTGALLRFQKWLQLIAADFSCGPIMSLLRLA